MTEPRTHSTAPVEIEMISYWTAAAVSVLSVFVLSVLLGEDHFERFFGQLPPLLVTALVVMIGSVSLRALGSRGWLPTRPLTVTRLALVGLAGSGLALPAVAFDIWINFPEDMNTPWPESLLFYPAIAVVAEVIFHVAPLAVLLTALGWNLDPHPDDKKRAVIAVVVVAAIEMLFHTIDALAGSDRRLVFFVVPQLTFVGICHLAILRRYGFAAMLSFRLGYYLIWHIAWGHIRLDLLF